MVMPWNRSLRARLYRLRRLQCPAAALLALLQRAPVVRLAAYLGDAFTGTGTSSAVTALVRSASAFAALGAIDTLAGATSLVTNTPSPLAASVGTAISPVVAFGVNGTQGPPESWTLKSTLPAGVTFGGLTGPGTVNMSNPLLEGTPTASGTFFLDLVAYEYPGGAGTPGNLASPDFLYTIDVTGSTIVPVTISSQPVAQTVVAGSTAVFSVDATSSAALTYQWALNGAAISGATSPRVVVSNPTTLGTATYTVTASNTTGGAASASTTLTVVATSSSSGVNPGRLINESVLAPVPTAGSLTVGFFSSAAGQRLLIRGIGPGLAPYGVTNPVADPSIKVFSSDNSTTASASNDNWGSAAAAINTADSATGAFALTAGSLDAALILTPTVTGSSVVYVPNTTGGTGLAEIYDYPTGTYAAGTTPRIVNLSTLLQVTAGSTLSAGFVVGGLTSKTFLIRAMGPTLAQSPFGLSGTMTDPQLTLVESNGDLIATNTNWGGDAQLSAAAAQVSAFAFATSPSLADSALLVTLPPGNYTAEATSASGASGTVLVEIYEVP
jgi:hypothetical protein